MGGVIKLKSILISIQPQWVGKILNGEKTIEIRKTMPKCELPCKVFIYCTKRKPTLQYFYNWKNYKPISEHSIWADGSTINIGEYGNGKVVAEFTLNKIETLWQNNKNKTSTATVVDKAIFEKQTCMTWEQYCEYHKCKNGKYPNSYAWHIDDLKIYDKPKELSEFYIETIDDDCCVGCPYHETPIGEEPCKNCYGNRKYITRPPQSWCYVEECNNGKYCV